MPDDKKWKPGDKVRLSSGGPSMTVRSCHVPMNSTKPVVQCQWFDNEGKLQKGTFPPESLIADDK